MAEENYIHGMRVVFEADCRDCSRYLEDRLDGEESKVFFEYARQHGKAYLRDGEGRKYSLSYKDGIYNLDKRS